MKPKYYSWSKEKWEKIAKRYYYSPCLAAKQLRINYQVIIYWWDHYNIPWRTKNRRYIEAAGRRWRKEQTKNKKKGGKPLVLGKAKNGFSDQKQEKRRQTTCLRKSKKRIFLYCRILYTSTRN